MRWEEMTTPEFNALDCDNTVVVLPVGAVEQHGRHMPVGTDTLLVHSVALAAVDRLEGVTGIVLPPPWYGLSQHHMAFAGTVTLQSGLMIDLMEQIAASVVAHGFRRLAIVNGHGGNTGVVAVAAANLGARFEGRARFAALTYFQLARDALAVLRRSAPGGMGHAGELETSLMQHLRPELVKEGVSVICYPDPGTPYVTTDLLGGSRVNTYLEFDRLSASGTLGDPSLASAEQGAKFFEAAVDSLSAFLSDFAGWPVEKMEN